MPSGHGEEIVPQTGRSIFRQGGESRSWQENPLDRNVREGSSPSARTITSNCLQHEMQLYIRIPMQYARPAIC
jgi:hypothetical protein